jgi:myo-inositol-1(or 4)-monophosphatase
VLKAAIEAARAAGVIQRKRYGTALDVRHKGPVDLVTEVDLACEEAILERLEKLAPGTAILSEEGGAKAGRGSRWLVDPLDGTTNFAHSYPVFCVSIALETEGRTELGVIYDPLRDELFAGERGKGARLNGEPMRVTAQDDLSECLLATGFPYDRRTNPKNNLAAFHKLTLATHGARRSGSAALDLAYVAAGRLDGFWEPGLKPWDTAAGVLLVEEAGGKVTGYAGQPYSPFDPEVVATNGLLHAALLEALQGVT